MVWTFNLSLDVLATVLATFPNIGRIFTQFSGHSGQGIQILYLSFFTLREKMCNHIIAKLFRYCIELEVI